MEAAPNSFSEALGTDVVAGAAQNIKRSCPSGVKFLRSFRSLKSTPSGMGRVTRWLRGFFGMNNDRQDVVDNVCPASSGNKREYKKWLSFNKPGKDLNTHSLSSDIPANGSSVVAQQEEHEEQQQQHSWQVNGMAMAATLDAAVATAEEAMAAAKAAVADAVAAVAVLRLSVDQRGGALSTMCGKEEVLAAVMIQSVFRGFLARKALRALRGLVRFQAVVRGYLVRKRVRTVLQCMQSLITTQTRVRSQRARQFIDKERQHPLENWKAVTNRQSIFCSKGHPGSSEISVGCPEMVKSDSIKPKSSHRLWTTDYVELSLGVGHPSGPSSFEISVDNSPKVVEISSVKPRSSRQLWATDSQELSPGVLTRGCGQPLDLELLQGKDYGSRFNSTCHSTHKLPNLAKREDYSGSGLAYNQKHDLNMKSFRAIVVP
ncbi:uncharacterized protein LOC116201716 isoform X2 [Punica granatum]|uniref:Uncharacterized protein LOC116201716 isoform X2 n=1 Tax=Punica granatum TaxID=22663 RepID=A0A6P8CW25_PUNGR|nr:uncharacterized protein LOC116201716 isoform X2 [Punica granatum]